MPFCSDITKHTINYSGSQLIKDLKTPKYMRHQEVSLVTLNLFHRWDDLLHERYAPS